MGTVTNIKMEPCNVVFGADVSQVQSVTTIADSSSSLNNKYFYLYDSTGAKFHVWINVGAAGVDPAPAGFTGIEVTVAEGANASAVATAVASAIDAETEFTSTASGSVVTITEVAKGYASPAADKDTGFAFAIVVQGDKEADVGFLDGDIEVTTSEDLVDLTTHQTGTNVMSQFRTGKQVEAAITLKETTVAQLRKFYTRAGGSLTPEGTDATDLFGWGTYKDFSQTFAQASKLKFHPIALNAADKSRDLTFFKAYPSLESLTFSGENILTLPVTFKCYPDQSIAGSLQYFAYGDASQVTA